MDINTLRRLNHEEIGNYHLLDWLLFKIFKEKISVVKDNGEIGTSVHSWRNCKMLQLLWKTCSKNY